MAPPLTTSQPVTFESQTRIALKCFRQNVLEKVKSGQAH